MLSIIFLLGTLTNELQLLQVSLPPTYSTSTGIVLEAPKLNVVKTFSLKRYKYRPVTKSTKYLDIEDWKKELRNCESGGNDTALNPKDLDGTPSHGRYQFKDTTFYAYAKKYNIKVTSYLNGDEQELLLDQMIQDNDVDLTWEFPDCTSRIGLPFLNYIEFSAKVE